MEFIDLFLRWIVAPIGAAAIWLYRVVQVQSVDIAVLKAVQAANKEAHDREFKEMRSNFKAVLDKLDSIEQHLRK